MPTEDEYEAALTAASKDLASAATAEDVRKVWRTHMGTLGHRTLGRLLLGQSLDRILERRQLRALSDD
jgi:hypothetical protein